MKITILLLFVTSFAFGQKKEVKADTVNLSEYQLQNLMELEKEIAQIKQVLEAKQKEQTQFLNGIISQYGEPSKLKWEFRQPNKIVLKKP